MRGKRQHLLRRFHFHSLHNTIIKKKLCETQLRFEEQKSALNTCAHIFNYEHF